MNRLLALISRYLLTSSSLACIFGITFSYQSPWSFPSPFLFLIPICIFVCSSWLQKNQTVQLFTVLLFFFMTGSFFGDSIDTSPKASQHIYNLIGEKQEVIVLGTLTSVEGFDGETCRIQLLVNSLRQEKPSFFTQATGKIILKLKDRWPENILPGDQISVRCFLKRPQSYSTPGSFDYPRFLKRKNVWITGYITSPLFIHKIPSKRTLFHELRYLPERIRVQLRSAIETSVPEPESGLYKALLIADRSGINRNLLEHFKGSGCMHLLAISGLHLSLLGSFLFFSLSWLLRRSEWLILHCNIKKLAALFCIVPLVTYTLIAGAKPPVLRSLIMALIVIAALCTDRKKSPFTMIFFAALLLLAANPSSLFSASFQLTFAAVISIAAILPHLSKCLISEDSEKKIHRSLTQKFLTWLYAALAVSISATVGTAPLLLYYFNRVSLTGSIANLVVEPLLCLWALPFGLAGSAFLLFSPAISSLLFKIGAIGLSLGIHSVTFFNSFPLANLWLPTPSLPLILIFYTMMLVLSLTRSSWKIRYKATSFFILVCLLLLFLWPPEEILKSTRKDATLTFMDVGHGSSTLIEMPGGKRVLLDGGGITTPRFDIGEQVIAPFLWSRGISRIDEIIVTHPDRDHINGLPFILKRFRPRAIWINTLSERDEVFRNLLNLASDLDVEIQVPLAGETLLEAYGAKIQSIANPYTSQLATGKKTGQALRKKSHHKNDAGLLIKFTYNDFSVLFPGDISKKVENMLLRDKLPIQAKILLSPHHGSPHSNSSAFLEAVNPEIMIVSTGRSTRKTNSLKKLRKKCKQHHISLLTTAQTGSITLTSTAKNSGQGASSLIHLTK